MLIIGQLKRLKMCLLLEESLLWTFLAHHKRIIIPFLSCNPTYGEQCPPCCSLPDFSFCLWKGVTIVPICKPYIFYRSDLLNTEIIITAALIRLYFRPQLSVLMKAPFHVVRLTAVSIKCRIPFITSSNLYYKSPTRPEKLLCCDLPNGGSESYCKKHSS